MVYSFFSMAIFLCSLPSLLTMCLASTSQWQGGPRDPAAALRCFQQARNNRRGTGGTSHAVMCKYRICDNAV